MRFIAPLRRHSVAFLALMVALGGGAYAQSRIGTADLRNNAVGPKKIKKNAVRGKHIKAGAVRPKKVRNNSLGARKLRNLRTLESSGWVGRDAGDPPLPSRAHDAGRSSCGLAA